MNDFSFHNYLKEVIADNRLAQKEGFRHVTCTGINGLEDVLASFQEYAAMVASDDITSGSTFREGGGYFIQRTFTVFVLHQYDISSEADRAARLDMCRELMRQLQSRLLRDRDRLAEQLVYLNLERMPVTEIGSYFASGCTGLHFMVTLSQPVDISYNGEEWGAAQP